LGLTVVITAVDGMLQSKPRHPLPKTGCFLLSGTGVEYLCLFDVYLMPKVFVKPTGSTVRGLNPGRIKKFFFHSGRSGPVVGPTQPPGHCILGHLLFISFVGETRCF